MNSNLLLTPLTNDWRTLLQAQWQQAYFQTLLHQLTIEYDHQEVFPAKEDLFNALVFTPYSDVKVVLIGQDPYHGPHQAHGLSFSVLPGVPIPRSLQNIYKELGTDLGCKVPNNGYLKPWADQGVLLLNTVFSVQSGLPNSHKHLGWSTFTEAIIRQLDACDRPLVFLLWGKHAQEKRALISQSRHLILEAAHPSPLSASRGFFGCRHFSKANAFLTAQGYRSIDWQIPDL